MINKLISASFLSVMLMGSAFAQTKIVADTTIIVNDSTGNNERRIIVKRNGHGNKKEEMAIVVDGERVTINGKPLEYWNDKDVKVFRNGPDGFSFSGPGKLNGIAVTPRMLGNGNMPLNRAVLGVSTEKNEKGAKITEVSKESAAEKSGLKKDDIITKVNDTKITDPESLYKTIGKFKPEEKVKLTYSRNGKEATTSAVLTKANIKDIEINNDAFNFHFPDGQFGQFNDQFNKQFKFNIDRKPRLGVQIQDLEEGNGVKITGVDEESPAKKAGLKENDIITDINGAEVKDVDDLRTKIKDLKEGDTYKVKYKRDGKSESIDIKIPKKLKTANL
jgi:serine protease Do